MTTNHKLGWERVAGSRKTRTASFAGFTYPFPAGLWEFTDDRAICEVVLGYSG
jgi:hypothetical protein